jgi:hypothetical protein
VPVPFFNRPTSRAIEKFRIHGISAHTRIGGKLNAARTTGKTVLRPTNSSQTAALIATSAANRPSKSN